MLSVIGMIIAELVTLIYGIGLVSPYILDTGYEHEMFVLLPFFVTVVVIKGGALLAYYLLIVAAIVSSCVWILLKNYKLFSKELLMKAKSREHSAIFDISGLLFTSIFMTLAIVFLAWLLGASNTGGVSIDDLEESLFILANASVWEELAVRVMFIGVPLLVVHQIKHKRRRWYSYILGGKFEFGIPEVVLVIASATIFGYAHYLGGWGAWKIPAAAIGGLAFGYLFLKHGLAAAIVMHFVTDYSAMSSEVFGFSNVIEGLVLLAWAGLGIAFTVYYIMRVAEFLTGKRYLDEKPRPTGVYWPQPSPYQTGPVVWTQPYPPPQNTQSPVGSNYPVTPSESRYMGYVCPYCGHTEARWTNGRFQCLRCGQLS